MRRYGFAFRPGWLALHVVTLAMIVTMVLLGRWQLHVSESKHFSVQNFGYTLQWWAFSAFAAAMWLRILRDSARRREQEANPTLAEPVAPDTEPVAYRRYVAPKIAPASGDPVHTAYNDYLARLAAQDAEDSR